MHCANRVYNAIIEFALFLTLLLAADALCLEGATNDSQGSCKDKKNLNYEKRL